MPHRSSIGPAPQKDQLFTEITAADPEGNVVAHAIQTYRIV